jgi:hypothetical protein
VLVQIYRRIATGLLASLLLSIVLPAVLGKRAAKSPKIVKNNLSNQEKYLV